MFLICDRSLCCSGEAYVEVVHTLDKCDLVVCNRSCLGLLPACLGSTIHSSVTLANALGPTAPKMNQNLKP